MKNNKGFFLAETIVMIALVTTIMAFVYPNVSKLYENYKNRVIYYDQTEDLYALRAVYDLNKRLIDDKTKDSNNNIGCKNFACNVLSDSSDCYIANSPTRNINEVYIVNYMSNLSSNNYNFNRYLKRIKKSTNDTSAYRLIGVFTVDGKTRYASIKIDNLDPTRECTNGG